MRAPRYRHARRRYARGSTVRGPLPLRSNARTVCVKVGGGRRVNIMCRPTACTEDNHASTVLYQLPRCTAMCVFTRTYRRNPRVFIANTRAFCIVIERACFNLYVFVAVVAAPRSERACVRLVDIV